MLIGEYEILETLGEGAAGVAYKARETQSGELVAVKLLNQEVAKAPDMQNRFVREVAVLEKLRHPGIVAHRDCGIHDGQIYCVMEFVDSGSLDEVLSEGGVLPWREAVEVAVQVSSALDHAHQHGVVHRDLKPANLFLTSDGQVKVGDFGLARDNERHRLTDEGQTVGTCRYMAPEQVTGDDQLTGAVDLYALGCLLHLMMTGRCPFDGTTVVEVFEHHLYTPPPRVDAVAPDCPPALAELVGRLLAKEAAKRPADAEEVRQALETILAGGVPEYSERTPEPPSDNLTNRLRDAVAPPERNAPNARVLLTLGILAAIIAFAIYSLR